MLPPATWYPDPSGRHEHRYWDGERWTEHVADAGIAAVDPMPEVTADEQVDGGVAADIAAVALASTSTLPIEVEDAEDGDDRDAGPRRRGRRRSDRPRDEEEVPDEDPWLAASAEAFVMPADAVPSLRDHRRREDGRAAAPGFAGLLATGPELADAHGLVVGDGSVTAGLALAHGSVLASSQAVRRVVGTVDLDEGPLAWLRRLSGEGRVTLVGDAVPVVLAPRDAARVVVRVDALLAVDGATTVSVVPAPLDVVELDAPRWFVLETPREPSVVSVDGDERRIAAARLVAWVGPLRVEGDPGSDVVVGGTGALLTW